MSKTIYQYILEEETTYQTMPIPVIEGYMWSMYSHCRRTLMYLNSQYETGKFGDQPFNNIVLDKINLQHRAVDIDVKDIQPFVDDPEEYYKSFIVRKYHDKWAREQDLGEFFNDLSETWTDYGGVIVKNERQAKPRVVPFNTLAFVDQSNIEGGPICEKHFFTPDQLKEYEGKWNNIDEVILLAGEGHQEKETDRAKMKIETPTQYIEVYELHGILDNAYLEKEGEEEAEMFTYSRQMHVVAFYKDEKGKKQGITLYSGKEKRSPYKVALRDKIAGRGLGRGGVEELFEAQVWVNYNEIQQKEMLDQASKIIYQTADPAYTTKNKTRHLTQGQVMTYEDGKPLTQLNTNPINVQFFEKKVDMWNLQAQKVSASFDSISGEQTKSGTPFRLGLMQNQEAHSLHLYRKEKLGLFLQTIYRDWILPYFAYDLSKPQTFLSELSLEELQHVALQVVTSAKNDAIKEKMFNMDGEDITQEKLDAIAKLANENFISGGNKKFIQIFQDEIKDLPLDVQIIITGEAKDNAFVAEKLSAIFAQIAQNPAILDNPLMERLFNEILEASGVSPMQFATMKPVVQPQNPELSPAVAPKLPTAGLPTNATGLPVA